ncbi:MAG: helix-turn-helix domain-containing protein [Patescibacteria group bacterium]|nr:helix-turn-helix domain-containing protein [Patescibacteria group bacterium]
MNQLSIKDRVQILNALSEGVGINAACRITGKSKNTILKLLADVGAACALYQDRAMNKLTCKRVEVDEIWSFVGAKQKNVTQDHPEGYGDCYTFTAIDPDTKLMPCWLVGVRSKQCALDFMADLAPRLANRVQLTTDGYLGYQDAVEQAFWGQVDYGVLNKSYSAPEKAYEASRRYSPPEFVTCSKVVINGSPDLKRVSTSIVERSNLTLRMGNRRFTRLTNAFSKKLENHMHAVSFYFMVYNFVKVHKSIRTTPAMEAGVTDFLWSMEDIVAMSETV